MAKTKKVKKRVQTRKAFVSKPVVASPEPWRFDGKTQDRRVFYYVLGILVVALVVVVLLGVSGVMFK